MHRRLLQSALIAAAICALSVVPVVAQDTGYQLDNVSDSTPLPGEAIAIHVNGFAPLSEVTITFFSHPVVLATVTADAQGVVDTTVTIPVDAEPGNHQIVVSGIDPDGLAKEVVFDIFVVSPVEVLSDSETPRSITGRLPFTGSDLGLVVAVGAVTVAVGVGLVTLLRRRDTA